MKSPLSSLFALASALTLAAGASPQLSGLKTNLRTIVGTGLYAGEDTHQHLGPSAGPILSGHSQAAASDVNASGSAVADATAAFGDLYVNLHAHGQKNPDGAASVTITHDGAPSAEFFDRIYVTGANVGAPATVHIDGRLTDLYRVEGSHRDIDNGMQGVDAFVYMSGYGNQPTIHLTSYRAGADVSENHSGSFDYATTVGGYFDIDVRLYGDAVAGDTYFRSAQNSSDGITQGRFLTSLRPDSQDFSLTSASGYNYQAVPEPAPLAALGLGLVTVLRRRCVRRN